MSKFDRAECEKQLASVDQFLAIEEELVSDDAYFNPAPLAEQLQSALAEIDRLSADRDDMKQLACALVDKVSEALKLADGWREMAELDRRSLGDKP